MSCYFFKSLKYKKNTKYIDILLQKYNNNEKHRYSLLGVPKHYTVFIKMG